ncbi:hypothetical protein K402DRAFT_861 [Aulographum hederae CBS 113979]|uniref:Uncharacterized protein n=1 Tax=Aulographum hederae CBS 113979 TaxID=1176131 RepID=A0A6G1HGB9_9PEZI|nr:hypothetical protein K402DRAFT_861 [Aulographum hederae CBS 113979]
MQSADQSCVQSQFPSHRVLYIPSRRDVQDIGPAATRPSPPSVRQSQAKTPSSDSKQPCRNAESAAVRYALSQYTCRSRVGDCFKEYHSSHVGPRWNDMSPTPDFLLTTKNPHRHGPRRTLGRRISRCDLQLQSLFVMLSHFYARPKRDKFDRDSTMAEGIAPSLTGPMSARDGYPRSGERAGHLPHVCGETPFTRRTLGRGH